MLSIIATNKFVASLKTLALRPMEVLIDYEFRRPGRLALVKGGGRDNVKRIGALGGPLTLILSPSVRGEAT